MCPTYSWLRLDFSQALVAPFAMASSGHRDVNLPRSTWHRAGGLLAEFGAWLRALGFSTWTMDKEPGNHLTNFWLYASMDSSSPAKSRVQFGCTQFAAVNPQVHAYARGKGQHLSAAVDLLRNFVSEVWPFEEQIRGAEELVEELAPAQHDEIWQRLDLRPFKCPGSERTWFSCEDAIVWFMPDDSGSLSTCGEWQAYQDEVAGVWWCNERRGRLFFPAAA